MIGVVVIFFSLLALKVFLLIYSKILSFSYLFLVNFSIHISVYYGFFLVI